MVRGSGLVRKVMSNACGNLSLLLKFKLLVFGHEGLLVFSWIGLFLYGFRILDSNSNGRIKFDGSVID